MSEGPAASELRAELEAVREEAERLRATVSEGGQLVRAVLDNVPAWIAYVDSELSLRYVNDRFQQWLGRPADEVLGLPLEKALGPAAFRSIEDHARAALLGELRTFEVWLRDDDRLPAHLNVRYVPHRDATGSVVGFISLVEDVTEAREAERRVAWSEEMLTRALTSSRMCAWAWDPRTGQTTRLQNAGAVMGVSAGTNDTGESARHIHPDDYEVMSATVVAAVKRGEPYTVRYRWQRPDDGRWIWLESYASPREDRDGRVRIYGLATDVTERQEADQERAALLSELQQALNAKDDLLGMVSHELRTPLTTLKGNSSALRRHREKLDPQAVVSALEDIERDADRLHRIVENMLALARAERLADDALEPLLLDRVVSSELEEYGGRRVGLSIRLAVEEEAVLVNGNETYVRHILGNLLSNAEKYGGEGSDILVAVRKEDAEAVVSVEDRGMGVSVDARESVFDAFFREDGATTAAAGLGLGLTVCRRLVQMQGGRIWVDSQPGKTTFSFALPLSADER